MNTIEKRMNRPDSQVIWKIIIAALLSRILVLAVGYVGLKATQQGAGGFFAVLSDVFTNAGDSPHYIKIAQSWYASGGEDAKYIVFFPLYPIVLRAVQFIVGSPLAAGMLVSNACFAAAACYVYRLASLDMKQEQALDALFLLLAFPFGVFYTGVFSEGLFVLLTAMGLYYARTHRWVACGIVGFLAALTRIQGVILLVPALYELCLVWSENRSDGKIALKKTQKQVEEAGGEKHDSSVATSGTASHWSKKSLGKTEDGKAVAHMPLANSSGGRKQAIGYGPLAFLLIPAGAGAYLLMNKIVQGDWFAFLKHQAAAPWYNSAKWIGDNLTMHVNMAQQYFGLGMILYWVQAALFFVGVAALMYGLYKKQRTSYLLYMAAYMFATYLHGWLLSGGRYMMACIPLYLVFAQIKNRAVKAVILVFAALMLALMTVLFFQKQAIM